MGRIGAATFKAGIATVFAGEAAFVGLIIHQHEFHQSIRDKATAFLTARIVGNESSTITLVKDLLRDKNSTDLIYNLRDHAGVAAQKAVDCIQSCDKSWAQASLQQLLLEHGINVTRAIDLLGKDLLVGGAVAFFVGIGGVVAGLIMER
ncbi:MAG: hypothetical protein KGH71_01650 [Candidatus Micrarchaeota archaeon]|nr:hypothetical protein [Candidatus Micrarchaeota archaeon]